MKFWTIQSDQAIMEVEDGLTSFDYDENLTLGSNYSLELSRMEKESSNFSMMEKVEIYNYSMMEKVESYSYDTSVRIVVLSVLLALALVGNSLAFHTLVTNRSEDSLFGGGFFPPRFCWNTFCNKMHMWLKCVFVFAEQFAETNKPSSITQFSCTHLAGGRERQTIWKHMSFNFNI